MSQSGNMGKIERYQYSVDKDEFGWSMPRPFLPLRLQYQRKIISVNGLVDTGSSLNVLPFEAGLELGLHWPDQANWLQSAGNLGNYRAIEVELVAWVGYFPAFAIAFAWTE